MQASIRPRRNAAEEAVVMHGYPALDFGGFLDPMRNFRWGPLGNCIVVVQPQRGWAIGAIYYLLTG